MMGLRYSMLEQLVGDSQALDRAIAGQELSYKDGLELMNYDNLHLLGAVADARRKELVGDIVTFAASYYMNYTNVCAASCQMCAFYRKDGAEDAYTLTPQEIEQRVGIAKQMGATEVHIVGGFHPKLPLLLDAILWSIHLLSKQKRQFWATCLHIAFRCAFPKIL